MSSSKPERVLFRSFIWNTVEIILLPILLPIQLVFYAVRGLFKLLGRLRFW